jgi:prepilin signal peptidase PulO-like enzyme (type II secretory pathway)
MKYALPYGTFLAIAGAIASLYGDQIFRWYTGFYG